MPDTNTATSFIRNKTALLFLLVVLVSLVVGQWLLGRTIALAPASDPPWTAVAVLFLGALALWSGRYSARQPAQQTAVASNSETPKLALGFSALPQMPSIGRLIALGGAILLTIWALWQLPRLTPQDSYTAVFLTWLAAFILFATAVLYAPEERRDWRGWLRKNRWSILFVIGVVAIGVFLRVWQIGSIPFTLGGDEASQGLEAIDVLEGRSRNPFTTGWLGVPTMSFFFNSLSLQLLGYTIAGLRLPWALIGAATVLVTFLLVQQLKGTKLALVTAVLLAVYHYHIHFSRLGSNQVADPFFLALALMCMVYGLQKKSRLGWLLAGAVAGWAFYFYAGARLTPVVITAVLLYLFILNPRSFWQENRVGVLIMLGAFIVVAAPMMQYALRYPAEFNARLNTVGIIQSGWLEREIEIRGESMLAILWDQFQRAALAFNFYPDRTVWYGLPQPLLDPFFGAIFLLGLIYGTVQLFDRQEGPRVAPMVAWWWGGMLLGGMFTESPPSSQRLITLAVPACFFIAYALWEILQLARQALRWVPVEAVLALTVFLFAFISLTTYFIDFTPQRLYGGRNAELATQIAPMLNAQKAQRRFYFVGAPWMYWDFATIPYLVREADAIDLRDPLTLQTAAGLLPPDKGALFLVIPPREQELQFLQQLYPQGTQQTVHSPIDGRIMVTLYDVPSENASE